MPAHPAGAVARHVRDLVERQRLDALPDGELLARYRAGRDDGAFAALVRRHGPLVLGTCRRILTRAHDAEDACQATFLVLARKAGSVRGGPALAGWLHRVAVRAACRLRRDLARRPTEPLPPDVANPAPTPGGLEWREVRTAFDSEVGRLPDRFRLPLVLCYLQGKTRAEAARRPDGDAVQPAR
ncbi:MAG TPA: sigma-70 family RNA polymerase sigma factor, partial [Gemmataceae bacterium]|nr:sigma-70 family RNA polymerase sigma factor [Gemmataceae bacterium]